MDGRRRGLVVGVDPVERSPIAGLPCPAEQGARDLHAVLTDPRTGTFDADDLLLLVGAQATTAAIKAALRRAALASTASDLLLLAFTGGATLPPWADDGEPYLVSADLDVDRLRSDPDAGLRLGFLRRDVFDVCQGSSLLVLDCCLTGRPAPGAGSAHGAGRRTLTDLVEEPYRARPSRHGALLACAEASAGDSRAPEPYPLTRVVLSALRGDAADSRGQVTFEALARCVQAARIDPAPACHVQRWAGALVLTRPHPELAPPAAELPPAPALTGADSFGLQALGHPLDCALASLTGLLQRAFAADSEPDPPGSALGRIRRAAQARAVGVVDIGPHDARLAEAGPGFRLDDVGAVLDQLALPRPGRRRDGLGLVSRTRDGLPVLAVPLTHARGEAQRTLVLVDPARSLLDLGEPVALLLHELWRGGPDESPTDVELRALTELRREFGRLPLRLYQHAFELYRQRLESLEIVFEPVVSLNRNPAMIGIESWEALARDGIEQRSAPTTLLDAAAVWGDEFVIERDVTLARASLRGYVDAHQRSAFRGDLPKPLSINVAVRSVLSDAYAAHLRAAIEEAQLSRGKLMLEISEKDPVAPAAGEIWLDHPMEVFRRRLTHLASTLHVAFAVDDFGVGHASLDRISALTLTQIKIDRAVLSHPLAVEEIGLVVRVAKHSVLRGACAARSVVMEGFDGSSDVSLATVFDAGVQLVQGYITEEPGSGELTPLGDVRGRIASMLGTRA